MMEKILGGVLLVLMGFFFIPKAFLVNYFIFFIVLLLSVTLMYLSEDMVLSNLFFYDGLSMSLVILSLWVSMLMYYSSYGVTRFSFYSKYFMFFVGVLMSVLVFTFFCGSFLYFYFFFEISLVPTLLIIVGWGYQPERLQAGLYFLFYTLTASLPLLVLILYFFNMTGSLCFVEGAQLFFSNGSFFFVMLGLMGFSAFLVKLPMYFTHLWLPKAHVEAPVAGSMILAGVLLKLGGYGLMRLFMILDINAFKFSYYLIGLSLAGMVYVGLICCRINDFKALVAYSSVAHMAMVISGLFSMLTWGYLGSVMMMIGHGLSSSGLFCIVNMYYERFGSRSFYINKGLIISFPIFSMLMFMLSAANIAAPPSLNLLSEIFLMVSILGYDYMMLLFFPLGSFLGAVFTIFMFSYTQHGALYYLSYGFGLSNSREFHTLVLHLIPLNLIVLNVGIFFNG